MKKLILVCLASFVASSTYASIPYCSGTDVKGSKHDALQSVIKTFAIQNNCNIGTNCILNFDDVKYSIAWDTYCVGAKGATFVCKNGKCNPFGFSQPSANY
ncbi:MAG: hypothetical protein HYX60_00195 [Legionella longbeachae]|nr:hypothetical protein [Legionella longbeachae]